MSQISASICSAQGRAGTRDRRRQPRLTLPLDVRFSGSMERVTVRDVSTSGLYVYAGALPGPVGSHHRLQVAITAGIKPLALEATVIRVAAEPRRKGAGAHGVALRFVAIGADDRQRLLELFDRAMRGPGTLGRAYPRIYQLLGGRLIAPEQLEVLVRDLGEGGAGLAAPRPLAAHTQVGLQLPLPDGEELRLGGWVMSCDRLADDPTRYRIGVAFARLDKNSRAALEGLLRQLYRN